MKICNRSKVDTACFPYVKAGDIVMLKRNKFPAHGYYLVIEFQAGYMKLDLVQRLINLETGKLWTCESLWGELHHSQIEVVTDKVCLDTGEE